MIDIIDTDKNMQ